MEEVVSVALLGDGEMLGCKLDDGVVGGVYLFVGLGTEHLDAAVDKDDAEDGQNPRHAGDKGTKGEDEDETEDDGSEDAPEKDAVVVLFLDAERDEYHNHHEDVVDREALFEEVAGEELGEHLAAVGGEVGDCVIGRHHPVAKKEYEYSESHGETYPDGSPDGSFFGSHNMVFLVEDSEVEGEHHHDEYHEDSEE